MKRKVLYLIIIIIGLMLIIGGTYLLSNSLSGSSTDASNKSSDDADNEDEEICMELDGDQTNSGFKISNVRLCFNYNLEISFDLTNNTNTDYTDIQVEFYLNIADVSYYHSIAIDSINSKETNNVVYTTGLDFDYENTDSYSFEMEFSQYIGG